MIFAGTLLLCALLYAVFLWGLPRLAQALLVRYGTGFTGHPVKMAVERIGLQGARLGETHFRHAGTDVTWESLDFAYSFNDLRQGQLESLTVIRPTITVDIEALERWLRERPFIIPPSTEEPEPPPLRPDIPEPWIPPPLPHPGVLWETPVVLSWLKELPVDRASIEAGQLTLVRGEASESMDLDFFYHRNEATGDGFLRLKGPRVFQRFEATVRSEPNTGTIRLAGSVIDGVQLLAGLFPEGSDPHPGSWLPAGAEAELPEILWEAAVETRDDFLWRGGGLIEAHDFSYADAALRVAFGSFVLGFQLNPEGIRTLSLGVNDLSLLGEAWWFRPEQISLFYPSEAGLAEIEIASAGAAWGDAIEARFAMRFALEPRAEVAESPMRGEIGVGEASVFGEALDPFVLSVRHEAFRFQGSVPRLRWEGRPDLMLIDSRFFVENPFAVAREVEAKTTLALSADARSLAHLTTRMLLQGQRIRAAWDLFGPAEEALGGGSVIREMGGEPWAFDFDLDLPGKLLESWLTVVDLPFELEAITGQLGLRATGRATDPFDARGSVAATFREISFQVTDMVGIQGLSGELPLQWVGLPVMEREETIRIAAIEAAGVFLEDVLVRIHWPFPHRFEIPEMHARLLGGTVRIRPTVLNVLRGFEGDFVVVFENIDAAALGDLFPDDRYEVEGNISGEIPLRFAEGRLQPMAGRLGMTPGTTARIRIVDRELREQVLAGVADDPRLAIRAKLANVLEQGIPLTDYSIRLFDPATPEFPAVIRATGRVRTEDIIAESISVRLNYAVHGVDWQEGFGWILDLLQDFRP